MSGNLGVGGWGPSSAWGITVLGSPGGGAVYGKSIANYGVMGESSGSIGVYGKSNTSTGVYGQSSSGYAGKFIGGLGVKIDGDLEVSGGIDSGTGGLTPPNKGVNSKGITYGVYGEGTSAGASTGVYGYSSTGQGIYGFTDTGYSGAFSGGKGVIISGDLEVTGIFKGNAFDVLLGISEQDSDDGDIDFADLKNRLGPGQVAVGNEDKWMGSDGMVRYTGNEVCAHYGLQCIKGVAYTDGGFRLEFGCGVDWSAETWVPCDSYAYPHDCWGHHLVICG